MFEVMGFTLIGLLVMLLIALIVPGGEKKDDNPDE